MSARTEEMIRRHVHARDLEGHRMVDSLLNVQISFAQSYLDLTEMAMQEEGVDPEVIRRVLEKVLYGTLPTSPEVDMRQQMIKDWQVDLERARFPVQVVEVPDDPSAQS